MKVFCFGDIHLGSSRYFFVREQEEKFCEWVLSSVKEWKCQRVIFLGDCFKERWHSGKEKDKVWMLFKEIAKEVDVVVIAGNHDYYDKSCEESSLVVFKGMSGVQVVDEEVWEDRVVGKDVVYVPWKWCLKKERKLEGDVVFGHFELKEAVWWEGENQICLSDFEDIRLVVSGHLHFRKKVGNVIYAGVPFQRSFGDGLDVGGVVVDLENMNCFWVDGYGVKFVQVERIEDLNGFDVSKCYVRVKERGLVEVVKRLGALGVEYVPCAVRSYDEEKRFQELERVVRIDLWQLLEEYGRKVLKVGSKEVKWLKDRCKENAV
jgi:DNA repair exonuclease SbcCD nuclease subunit